MTAIRVPVKKVPLAKIVKHVRFSFVLFLKPYENISNLGHNLKKFCRATFHRLVKIMESVKITFKAAMCARARKDMAEVIAQ
jgi:hypothetical protein